MRVLLANDGAADAGGVHTYLAAVGEGLRARGHEMAYLFCDDSPGKEIAPFASARFNASTLGRDGALEAAADYRPNLVYSHNMQYLDVERGLLERFPVVKFMHGYDGTCISGLKLQRFPRSVPCSRPFGPACLALYLPCRCGQLDVRVVAKQYRWTAHQQRLFPRYQAVVVASRHMREEYIANGVPAARVHVNPLFAPPQESGDNPAPVLTGNQTLRLLFLGRMTKLKGGDLLLRAAALIRSRLSSPISIVMAGDGPQRPQWEALARQLNLDVTFPGWLEPAARSIAFRSADLLVMPSVWPEPFGFVGLEAAREGLPAVAFDVGGVREWLDPGVTGWLTSGPVPTASSFAATLYEALSNPDELQSRGHAAQRHAAGMSLTAHLDRLEQLFETVQNQR